MAHLNYFGIENFRVFKEKTEFNLKPITVLIGENSSGKSSLNKALFLFKETFNSASLDFESVENKLQLGGFENSISWGKHDNIISYYLPFKVFDYPMLGQESIFECKICFDKERIQKYTYLYNDEIIVEYDFKNFKFNAFAFFENLQLPETFEIKEIGVKRRGIFREVQGNGNFAIIDKQKPSRRSIEIDSEFGPADSLEEIPFTEILLDNDRDKLLEILDFYRKKFENDSLLIQQLEFPTIESYGNGETYESSFFIDNPIKELLSDHLSANQLNFLNRKIFNNFFILNESHSKHNFFLLWKTISEKIKYFQSITERTKRIYQLDNKDIISQSIRKYLENKSEKSSSFLKHWSGENGFNLLGDIEVIENVEYAFRSVKVGINFLSSEGQGISQIVSLILNLSSCSEKIFLIEEPEICLHPSFQSKLADFFVDAQKTFNHQFIIETHSEYLIRKLQLLAAKKVIKHEDVTIYNFRKQTKNNLNILQEINIEKDGFLDKGIFPGFYDESDNLAIYLFNLRNKQN